MKNQHAYWWHVDTKKNELLGSMAGRATTPVVGLYTLLALGACVQIAGIEKPILDDGGAGSSGGAIKETCQVPADCPPPGNDCIIADCFGGVCVTTNVANGLPLAAQVPGDCLQVQCNGNGGMKTVNDNTDAPTIDCQIATCISGTPMYIPAAQGTACTTAGGISCDGEGNCVQCNTDADCGQSGILCDLKSHTCFSCTDGIQNGDESDVNCGGDRCPACIQGKKCNVVPDCASNLLCTDGICCNIACDQPCEACNLPTSVGTCDYVAKYGEDPSYGMGMSCTAANMKSCTGTGACRGALGEACIGPTDCASGKCSTFPKICVKTAGDPCAQNPECFSNICMNGVCG